MAYIVLGVLCVLLLKGCTCSFSDEGSVDNIIGGDGLDYGEGGWVAEVYVLNVRKILCGGSLIGRKWVMTLATCIYGFPASSAFINLGISDLDKGGLDNMQFAYGSELYIHPDFNSTSPALYNIALIKLDRIAKVGSRFIDPIPLATPELDTAIKKKSRRCFFYGLGKEMTEDGFYYNSGQVRRVKTRYIKCKNNDIVFRGTHMDCTKSLVKDVSQCEDEGHPIVCRHQGVWYQTGIATRRDERDACHTPYGTAINVANFASWISSIVD